MHKIKQGFCGKVGEYMIFDELVVTINALDNLKKKTDLKNNKALQDNTDAKYRLLLSQTNSYISTIEYVYTNVPYAKNIEILTATLELLDNLEKVIESGAANQEEVSKAENVYKTLCTTIKKEWSKKYSDLTGSTISTLEAIKGIDSKNVNACLQKIQTASEWDVGIDRFKNMLQGIASAEQLIQKLGLDDEIILFLQNTNAGKATLLDLNDKVLNWIRSEKLENKIRISFVRK